MFELDQGIARWRQQMLDAGLKSPEPLDELESHLRDDISEQMRSGLDAPHAFEVAVQRFGQAHALNAEFEKAGETRRARELKLMGAIMLGAAGFYGLFVESCVVFKLGSFSDIDFNQQLSASVAGALTVVFLLSGRFGHRFFPVVSHKRTRAGIYAAGIFLFFGWLGTFYQLLMTRFEFDMSQLVVSLLWVVSPWGALMGTIYGLEHAALHKVGMRSVPPSRRRQSS